MKKIVLVVSLLVVSAAAGRAQESRQDVSLSGTALIQPFIASQTDVQVNSNTAYGALASYRFMLTPTSALEANYGITYQNTIHFYSNPNNNNVLVRTQEVSGAFVRSFVFRNWNPFVEAGPAGIIFLPIRNSGTQILDAKQQTEVGALYGAGFSYEISPSFDIRAEYRGLVTKVPTFGQPQLNTNKWWNMFQPAVGVAYHF
jgi:outer membrane immunogenic protein